MNKKLIGLGLAALLLLLLLFRCLPKIDNSFIGLLTQVRNELEGPGITVEEVSKQLRTADAALEFVQKDILYIPYSQRFQTPGSVLRTRVANMGDRAVLLAALLRTMGYETSTVQYDYGGYNEPYIGSPVTDDPPTLAALMEHIGYNPEQVQDDLALQDRFLTETVQQIQTETAAARAIITERIGSPVTPPVSESADDTWTWVKARKGDGDWQIFDPNYPDEERPNDVYTSAVSGTAPVSTLEIIATYSDGSETLLLEYEGDTSGLDTNLSFLPADRSPALLSELEDPTTVGSWLPVLQVGNETVIGNAFTPNEGLILNNLHGKPNVTVDDQNLPIIRAVPVESMELKSVDAKHFPTVRLNVAVETDGVPYWHAKHFTVKDNSDHMNPRLAAAIAKPLPVVAVLDTSGSMDEENRLELAKAAAVNLIETLPADMPFTLKYFLYEQVKNLIHVEGLPEDRTDYTDRIQNVGSDFGTPLIDSIEQALTAYEGPSYILLLTDGEDTEAGESYEERVEAIYNQIKDSGKTFITLGIGEADEELLQQLAKRSGGTYFPVKKVEHLPKVYEQISNIIAGRVLLEYEYPEATGSGTLHNVRVALEGYDGTVEGAYTEPLQPEPPVQLTSIDIHLRHGAVLNQRKTVVQLGDTARGWELMQRFSLWMSPGMYSRSAFSARRFDHWIALATLQEFIEDEEVELPPKNSIRGASLNHAQAVRAFAILQRELSGEIPWHPSPTLLLSTSSLFPDNGELIRRQRLDWLWSMDPPIDHLALAGIEAQILDTVSSNQKLVDTSDSLNILSNTGGIMTIGSAKEAQWYWEHHTETGETMTKEQLAGITAKGASAERIAAQFDEIHKALAYASYGGYTALGLTGAPLLTGSMMGAVVAHIDTTVSLYCYATVMMNYVSESIGGEDFDAAAAQVEAGRLCGLPISPEQLQREFYKNYAKEYARATALGMFSDRVGNLSRSGGAGAVGWADDYFGITGDRAQGFVDAVDNAIFPKQ